MIESQTPPRLGQYSADFDRGRSRVIESLWILIGAMLVSSFLPGSAHRRFILRVFGAKIGRGVVIKPGVRIKFPWRLEIGENCWLGENCWIDNLAKVSLAPDAVISQGAYLCTGSHDWSSEGFDLITEPITLEAGAWVGAFTCVGPGVTIGEGAILTLGSVATRNLDHWGIHSGNPATRKHPREVRPAEKARRHE